MNILLLNGGGLGSLCLAKLIKTQYPEAAIHSLNLVYGNPAYEEQDTAARVIAAKYCTSHKTLSMVDETSSVNSFSMDISRLIDTPFYASLLMINGYSYAVANSFDYVITGLKAPYILDFIMKFEEFISMSTLTDSRPVIQAPFMEAEVTDEDIYNYIKDENILTQTYSCNLSPACGECAKCKFRSTHGI